MGRRGPPPKLKVIAGTFGKGAGASRLFPPGTPSRPTWLSRSAAAEWKRIVPELEAAGMLSVVDRAALSAYCQAWAELVETTKVIEKEGRICEEPIQNATGEIIGQKLKAHPAVRLQRDAFARVKAFLIEFGLSPAARARMTPGGSAGGLAVPADRLNEIRGRVQKTRAQGPPGG